ncbi:Ger(x)C family spore germination protein [Desulfitobacterium sp. PCE1]|uniref:Ger(x)C family spore germination protein n=1 Tax=Desulfitobacterium sp. PCE1 TaxID=146907 RepID=UPI0003671C96|nr:Ger(x)C family spore germination protein [Desulfitobacterium sp. PCE1]
MKKCLCLALCFLLPVNLLLGCWDRNELSTLAIVQAIGIDMMEDGRISLSTQILKPGALKSGSEKSIWVATSTGETLFDAVRNASLQTDRRLFFPHNKAIIISEETAKKGLVPLFDFLMRDVEVRDLTYVFVAKGKAVDILKGEHEQETNPSKAIENLAETSVLASILPKRYLIDLLSALENKTTSPILPGIKIHKENKDSTFTDMIVLDNTAVFKKDRLVGWFDPFEARGALWVLNEVKSATIVVESPLDEDKAVSLDVIKSIARLKPEITDSILRMTIKVKVEGNLTEQMSSVNLTSPKNFAELEKRAAAIVEEEIMTAIVKAQKWGGDILKFGEEFHRKYPQEWTELEQDWDELFPEIEVKLDVSVQLNLIGLSSEPLNSERME